MTRATTAVVIAALMSGAMAAPVFAKTNVEVLDWWTSGGEAAAISVLKKKMESQGYGWQDDAVAGGGGAAAMTALKARVTAGNPPTAAQISMAGVQQWAREGLLGDLTPVAEKEGWAKVLPPPLKEAATYQGKWVGVPFNIHRSNWLWINAKVFAKYGLTPPTTWSEFFAEGDKLKADGIIPLALGGEPWQETILLEDAMLSVGGADFYRKAFIELDPKALDSEQMIKSFDILGKLRNYVDPGVPGRPWNDATAMVLNGKAAMQLMGDWAKGEITNAHMVPGKDILCVPAPGNKGIYNFHVDYFMMFKAHGGKLKAQYQLASDIMGPSFQKSFNEVKGSIPANMSVTPVGFDACAKDAMKDIKFAIAHNTLTRDMDGGAAQTGEMQGAIMDVVAHFFASGQSSKAAAAALVQAVNGAR